MIDLDDFQKINCNLIKLIKSNLIIGRSYDDEYETEGLPIGYIAYKINTCAKPGNRDLSAYAGIFIF